MFCVKEVGITGQIIPADVGRRLVRVGVICHEKSHVTASTRPRVSMPCKEHNDSIIKFNISPRESHERFQNVFLSSLLIREIGDIAGRKAQVIGQYFSNLLCIVNGIRKRRHISIGVDSYDQRPARFILRLCKESYVLQLWKSPMCLFYL